MKKICIIMALVICHVIHVKSQTYCLPNGTFTVDTKIVNVVINGVPTPTLYSYNNGCINQAPGPSSNLGIYSNFTSLGPLTSITQGSLVTFSVSVDYCSGSSQYMGIAAWIDFNHNGSLTDSGEQIYIEAYSAAQSPRTINGSFTVPPAALTGTTLLRVMAVVGSYSNNLTPCLYFSQGEAEDYAITIVPSASCTGTPATNTVNSITSSLCYSNAVSISLANSYSTAVSYQWYASNTSLAGPFTAIPGATMSTYAASVNITTWYQAVVGCGTNTITTTAGALNILNIPLSGVYTINSASATAGTNFHSFSDLAYALNCVGVSSACTVNVVASSGPYNEQANFNNIPGMSVTNSIVINGNSNVITYLPVFPENYGVLNLTGASYMTFNNLTASTSSTRAAACHLSNSANYNTFNNCTFSCQVNSTNNYIYPVYIESANYNNFTGSGSYNTWNSCNMIGGYTGVYIYYSFPFAAYNNFYNCNFRDFDNSGIDMLFAKNTIIKGCIFERPTRVAYSNSTFGIYLEGTCSNILIEGNRIQKLFNANATSTIFCVGIYSACHPYAGGGEIVIRNNIISDLNSNGQLSGITVGSGFTKIQHNTISLDHAGSASTYNTTGINSYNYSSTNGVEIQNNVISVSRGGNGKKYCLYFDQPSGVFSNQNVLSMTATGSVYIGYSAGNTYTTFPQWQLAGFDQNGIAANPVYSSSTTLNYQPTNNAIDNLAFPLGITTDFTGASRNLNNPDPGAYEFNGTTCSGTPTAGSVTAISSSLCPASTITLTVNGGSANAGLTYSWQTSASGSGPWTNIAGANGISYFGAATSTLSYYQRITTCTLSSQTATTAAVSLSATGIPLSGVYTINSASLTAGTNYQTFNALASALNCYGVSSAVTVNVVSNSGPYNEQVDFGQIAGTSATNSIVINGNSNQIFFIGQIPPLAHVLNLSGADYMTFNNLQVTGTGTLSLACHLSNAANYNTFNNCTFECLTSGTFTTQVAVCINGGNGRYDIAASTAPSNYNVFNGCTMSGGYAGVVLYGGNDNSSNDAKLTGNAFNNCTIADFQYYGVYNYYSSASFSGNTIERTTRTTASTPVYGLYFDSYSGATLVERNKIWKLADAQTSMTYPIYGIFLNQSAGENAGPGFELMIKNNIIGKIQSSSDKHGIYNRARNVTIYHNTISLDYTSIYGNCYGIYNEGLAGISVKNNNIYVTGEVFGFKVGLFYYGAYGIASNYNNIYCPSGSQNRFARIVNTSYTNLSAWQAQGLDLQSTSLDPTFTSLTTPNYLPTNNLLNNTGTPVGVTNDLNNATRNLTAPDVGAYEFGLAPCSVQVSYSPSAVCSGNTVSLTASGATSYTWSFGANAATATLAPVVYNTYTLTGSSSGCAPWTKVFPIAINYVPVSIATSTTAVCPGGSVTLNAGGVTSYTWAGGVNNGVPFAPANTSTYVVSSSLNGCVNSASVAITVNPIPTLNVNSGTVCVGNQFVLSPSGASSYTFSSGSASVTPSANTIYTVTGTSSLGCVNTTGAAASVTIVSLPTLSISSGSVCSGSSFTLNPGGAATYTFSGGSSVVSPATTTTYVVSGTSSVGCIAATNATATVTVYNIPATTVNSGSICLGQTFTMTPGGNADTYTFSSVSTTVNPGSTAAYTVTGTNTITGCFSKAISTVSVNPIPIITVNSGSVCLGSQFVMNVGGASTYTFSNGSASVSPSANASYTVTGTSSLGCVNSTGTVSSISVLPLPTLSVTSGSICSGRSFTISPSGASTYTYSGGSSIVAPGTTTTYAISGTNSLGCIAASNVTVTVTVFSTPTVVVNSGSICAGSNFTMSPTGADTYTYTNGSAIVVPVSSNAYTVTGTNTLSGCSNQAVSNVTVNPIPVLTANSGSICQGQFFTIIAGGASSYTFNSGAAIVSPNTTTAYIVSGTSSLGCTAALNATATVTVYTLPVISVNSGSICSGSSFTLSPSGASSYTFSNGSTIVSPTQTSSYSVTGTSSLGCTSSLTAVSTVSVYSNPTVSVNSGSICAGGSFTLLPNGAAGYTYSGGQAVVTPALPGDNYTVTGVTINGCYGTAVSTVVVLALPNLVPHAVNPIICAGETTTLFATGASVYIWSTSETNSLIVVGPGSTRTYTVTGTGANGCSVDASITQSVSACDGIAALSASQNIKLYPNPNSGNFIVECSSPGSKHINITDVSGRLVDTTTSSDEKIRVDLSVYAKGIYYVNLELNGNHSVFKVIVQ